MTYNDSVMRHLSDHYLPLAAWHLIKRTALKHPPKVVGAVALFFLFNALMSRLRGSRWRDVILYAVVTTAIAVFVASAVYILLNQPGFRLIWH